VLLSTGCVSTQQNVTSPYHDYSNLNYLSAEFSQLLVSARVGQQLNVDQSPWGVNTLMVVTEKYFAASGRQCLKLQVSSSNQLATVCQHNLGWVLNPEFNAVASQG
jgi:hypothetical protein